MMREEEELASIPSEKRLFEKTEAMEQLFDLLNRSFDVMNARCPLKGIKREYWTRDKKVPAHSQSSV